MPGAKNPPRGHPDPAAPIHGDRFLDPRWLARSLYWRGWGITELTDELNRLHGLDLKRATVASWKTRDGWDKASCIERCESATEARYCQLVAKETKTGSDFKEIDLLGRQIERMARVRRYQAPGGHEGDLNPRVANRNAGEKKKARKNHLTEDDQAKLKAAFSDGLFAYQLKWRDPLGAPTGGKVVPIRAELASSTANVTRFILKSRQIGATFYFAREALIRALETGNNQIFISASRAQANIFRQYICAFVAEATGVKLEGDPIILDLDGVSGPMGEPVKLYFLGTNYRTAQGYHGDVYVDECFWIYGFEQIDDVAAAMASHKRYRITYFSTPSTVAHQAFKLWSGERFNEQRSKADRADFKFSDEDLRAGVLGADGVWRQRVSLLDAEAGGCDLFDIERLRQRYAPDVFDNLFLCQFVDDSQSMFPFALMRRAMVDSWDAWIKDFDPYKTWRPFGDKEVWIGYDPAESAAGDDAALVIIAPPEGPKGKFRVLEKHRLKGQDFQAQADFILKQLERYHVTFVGIDSTGVGASVYQLVVAKFPTAKRFDYSVPLKNAMVLKAKNVFTSNRIEFDSGALDIANSFMAIRAQLTKSQREVTYVASRAGDTGHADLAWAIMHALYNEPLDPIGASSRRSRLRISGNATDDASGSGRGGGSRAALRDRDRRDAGRRRDEQRRRVAAADVPLRRSRAGHGSPRLPVEPRVPVERQMVRAADPAARARAHDQHVGASPVGDPLQAQPAAAVLQAVALPVAQGFRRVRARLPQPRQWLSRAA